MYKQLVILSKIETTEEAELKAFDVVAKKNIKADYQQQSFKKE